eukprot:3984570-Prymnesium_polylepis.1
MLKLLLSSGTSLQSVSHKSNDLLKSLRTGSRKPQLLPERSAVSCREVLECALQWVPAASLDEFLHFQPDAEDNAAEDNAAEDNARMSLPGPGSRWPTGSPKLSDEEMQAHGVLLFMWAVVSSVTHVTFETEAVKS